jgi:hypothetical protein
MMITRFEVLIDGVHRDFVPYEDITVFELAQCTKFMLYLLATRNGGVQDYWDANWRELPENVRRHFAVCEKPSL